MNSIGSPQEIWQLQLALLDRIETAVGPRDPSYTVCQPRFGDMQPHIFLWPESKELVAYLSRNAEQYWPTLVFELAHESVHMLNPISGHTNVLEEGVATYFQFHVAPQISGVHIPITDQTYLQAKETVEGLDKDVLQLAKVVRERCGRLSDATSAVLKDLYPMASPGLIERLAAACICTNGTTSA